MPAPQPFTTGKHPGPRMNYRFASIAGPSGEATPSTIDTKARSVEVIAATEMPAEIYDWDHGQCTEVLLMDGCEWPPSGQVPFLNCHDRFSVEDVLGSFRGIHVEQTQIGQILTGTVFISAADDSGVFDKMSEGHLTDVSVGYRQISSEWVPDGETRVIRGRSFQGPVLVTHRWRLKELSAVPIGADELAKARSEANANTNREGTQNMPDPIQTTAPNPQTPPATAPLTPSAPAAADVQRQSTTMTQSATAPPDFAAITQDAIRAERERVSEISLLGEHFGCRDITTTLITSGATIDAARAAVIEHLKKVEQPTGYRGVADITYGADVKDKFRAAAQDSLLMRGGLLVATPAAGHDELMGFTMRELAKECLRMSGQNTRGNPLDIVKRALTYTDLPNIMANVANKSLFDGFTTAQETWQEWCGTGSVTDFKTHSSMRISESDDLDEIAESEEYEYGSRSDTKEQYSIATYGKMFAVTRQAIINDDLGALTRIPASHGEACARKIGDVAYGVLTANSAMGDGVALFDAATHKNYVAVGSGAAPGIDTLTAGILAMGTQKDLKGVRRLNIRPEFFIAPKALEGYSEILFRSQNYASPAVAGTPDSAYATTRVNPYAGTYFSRIYDPRLDDSDVKTWYLATTRGKTVILYFLNGQQTPYMETQQGWEVDGLEYKVRIDVGAKAMDWRGLYANVGH